MGDVRPETPDLAGLAEGGIDPTPHPSGPAQADLREAVAEALERAMPRGFPLARHRTLKMADAALAAAVRTHAEDDALLAAANRATDTAEKLMAAIERISAVLGDETAPEKARVMRARTVLAGLDQGRPDAS